MTHLDWNPLSGDPSCSETIEEWASEMLLQLATMNSRQCTQTISEMTEDERDAIRMAAAKTAWLWS